ncbi:jg17987 [Pararge aegeria aegeria]|uniref:Jg17987 protein n=1 Tax=Pararge aegeria aegeria TaxID=348720 RepID=A0A8S4S2P0_9NEOP|nr:jg17987 [Pararge aegeria aegeria]
MVDNDLNPFSSFQETRALLTDHRWTKTVTTWRGPPGKRYRGRPGSRWDDDIKKIAGPQWIQIAQDTERWQALAEGPDT